MTSSRTMMNISFSAIIAAVSIICSSISTAQQPILSPRDSVEVRIAGKRIFIDYGRPSMRGRKIFGGLRPFNQWWRTGANEATSFKTEADLVLGDSLIPKGEYTLYTLPSETQWKIMINKQTGQWGTVYNPEYDLVRLPLKKRTLKEPVEKLTIELAKTNTTSGVLRIMWETTEVWIDFKAKTNNKQNSH